MKKTWNVWKYNKDGKGSTGPWEFFCAVLAVTMDEAIEIGRMRGGLDGNYKAYEGI